MSKEVLLWTGAGQVGMAIARRVGYGKKILMGDKSPANAEAICKIMTDAGFDCEWMEMDLSDRAFVLDMVAYAQELGEITMLINAAGVSPSQASIETILKVDLHSNSIVIARSTRATTSGSITGGHACSLGIGGELGGNPVLDAVDAVADAREPAVLRDAREPLVGRVNAAPCMSSIGAPNPRPPGPAQEPTATGGPPRPNPAQRRDGKDGAPATNRRSPAF